MTKELWSVGITMMWRYDRWFSECEYQSFTPGISGISLDDLSGKICAKYGDSDALIPAKITIAAAQQIGVIFDKEKGFANIYAEQDGEGIEMPDGWRDELRRVAEETGFTYPYRR